ncbi:hypothetical protein Ami103574_04410 [Aminipila butyrica]|uniref:Phage terminase small subunit n=1 Tax=Aminipila butyrica TaxID=433296 RepID=A0A858BU59_9FIRM|nr:hypothetical protein [Aminipila butyrica]QIB68608.1 hypothetical protein Ami103574_04410 [Aminipila butyrica]
MPTPAKPYAVLVTEGKSHRTKAELDKRKKGEDALATGTALKERPEVKRNPTAHKEFSRINKLLLAIEKNDAIYEPVINRYCMMQAECLDLEVKREKIYDQAQKLEKMLDDLGSDVEFDELRAVISDLGKIYGAMLAIDKQVQSKRKMLLEIEKENVMTIAAALRTIPKKTEEKEDPLLKVLRGG